MDRRDSIKTLVIGALTSSTLLKDLGMPGKDDAPVFESQWQRWPDMRWTGPAYWGNRLQDWQLRAGQAECRVSGLNRSLHCLTHRLGSALEAFESAITVVLLDGSASPESYVGLRLGAKGPFDDYRSAAVFGEGLDVGISSEGHLFIGDESSSERVATDQMLRLLLEARPHGELYQLTLKVFDERGQQPLSSLSVTGSSNRELTGTVALVSHFEDEAERPSVRFSDWVMRGHKLVHEPKAAFGPVCFAQYTLHRRTLKLTAQLAPIEQIDGHHVALEILNRGQWQLLSEGTVDALSRTAHFRVEDWEPHEDIPYRIRVTLPLRDGKEDFYYEGSIAHEPSEADQLKVAVFSCNSDYGFPDSEVVRHVGKHRPHLAVFLGDQYYESHGGFGIQTAPLEKASLDFLHKWYMFGWSYRDIFRGIPAAFIPDDHDVYHGNIWGEGGKDAPTDEGWGYAAQDQGGYKMPPAWVDAVQRAQTSHLPDPYDSKLVKQGIGVYYTNWDYAGISFAIIEDRKFKSAPRNVLPEEAQVVNGFITNLAFDINKHRNQPDARLLGERQMSFLEQWVGDWGRGMQMKAVLSQTNFCTLHTLPKGSTGDQMVPRLPIPPPGAYVEGDAPALDMDSNGWPPNRRDEVLQLIRKAFAFHIAGDQHLASMVQYGVENFEDAGFAFTGPALNSIWPRRWWPPVDEGHQPLPGRPPYTGNFMDAFGNRVTVHAVANPHQTGLEPSLIYDRSTGYGIVTFNKVRRTIEVACWPRYVDPDQNPDDQYQGWPITVRQEDNYGRTAHAWLPEIQVNGLEDPVVEIVDEDSGEMLYTLRIKGRTFQPKVFADGTYTIRVGEPDRALFQKRMGVPAIPGKEAAGSLAFSF